MNSLISFSTYKVTIEISETLIVFPNFSVSSAHSAGSVSSSNSGQSMFSSILFTSRTRIHRFLLNEFIQGLVYTFDTVPAGTGVMQVLLQDWLSPSSLHTPLHPVVAVVVSVWVSVSPRVYVWVWPCEVPIGCLCGVGESLDLRRGPLGSAVGGRRPNSWGVLFERLGLLPDLPDGAWEVPIPIAS